MTPHSLRGQLLLLRKHNVPTRTWGLTNGTKPLARLIEELTSRDVLLIEHPERNCVLRVARRVKCRIYYSAQQLLYLREIERKYPNGYVRHMDPTNPPYWSVTETRHLGELPHAAMKRGIAEELRTPDGFFVDIDEHELRTIAHSQYTEVYEEHDSRHYPGLRSGNFDVNFNLTLTSNNFRPYYFCEDHGVEVTFGWGAV